MTNAKLENKYDVIQANIIILLYHIMITNIRIMRDNTDPTGISHNKLHTNNFQHVIKKITTADEYIFKKYELLVPLKYVLSVPRYWVDYYYECLNWIQL